MPPPFSQANRGQYPPSTIAGRELIKPGYAQAALNLEATNGDDLCFNGVIGDAGEVESLWFHYEFGFDTSQYAWVE
jgi:hypothetical protein